MANNKVDFYQLGNKLWNIANIFRDDTLKTTEYLEEFSYFLFLKLFDDQERQKEELAKLERKPFTPALPEELRFHTWARKIINNEIDVTQAVKVVQDVFQKLANIQDHDGIDLSLFRKLFKNHIWRIKYGPTIRELLKQLVDLELEQNFDVMGRAYEFVVQKLGEQKQYGQYFTPRHIIHFMVELADPEIDEMIYDPAAGTGGFILRAFEIVKNKIIKQAEKGFSGVSEPIASYGKVAFDRGEKLIRRLKEKHLWAVEKAPDVFKLAMMNMILHSDGKSNLYESDSLDNRAQQEHKEKYDVVLSNPPYGPLTQSRTATFTYHVKRFEALFFQHIMNALKYSEAHKKPSRAVVIILDKILFDNTNAFKNIRKKLLREYNLKAVFSMPAGIFQPYSGVKTTVMYFERPTKEEWKRIRDENGFATQKVMFFDIQSDGFTLATQRRPINGAFQGENPNIYEPPCGDLPKAVEVFKEWQKALENGNIEEFKEKYVDNKQVWIADIEEIKEKDFNLNPGLYRKVERGKVKWEWVKVKDIASEIKVKGDEGVLPYIEIGDIELDTKNYIYKDKPSLKSCKKAFKNNIIISNVRPTRGAISYIKERSIEVSNGFTILDVDQEKALPKFLFYLLAYNNEFLSYLGESSTGSNYPTVSSFYILNYKVPLPPLEIQQQIVERLDKQQAIIEKAKEMEKTILDAGIDDAIFEGDWDWVELGDLITYSQYGLSSKADGNDEDIPILGMNNITYRGNIDLSSLKFIKLNEEELKKYKLQKGDILFNRTNSKELVGKTSLFNLDGTYVFASYLIRFKVDEKKVYPKYIVYFMNSNFIKDYLQSLCRAIIGQANINLEELKSIKIPLPPLEKQQEILSFLDTQFKTLEHIRKLQENAERTIKLILEKEVFTDG